jgi:hypothetical protein
MVDNPNIVIAACSTGQEDGFAQRLSCLLGATVHASCSKEAGADIRLIYDVSTKKQKFDVTFVMDNELKKAVVYQNGQKITSN